MILQVDLIATIGNILNSKSVWNSHNLYLNINTAISYSYDVTHSNRTDCLLFINFSDFVLRWNEKKNHLCTCFIWILNFRENVISLLKWDLIITLQKSRLGFAIKVKYEYNITDTASFPSQEISKNIYYTFTAN